MNKFTEKELIELGFTKEYSLDTTEVDGYTGFYYFTFDNSAAESLITNASDELIDGGYIVEMFNVKTPRPLSKEFVTMYTEEFKK